MDVGGSEVISTVGSWIKYQRRCGKGRPLPTAELYLECLFERGKQSTIESLLGLWINYMV